LDKYRVNYVVKEVSPAIALLRAFSLGAAVEVSSSHNVFSDRVAKLLAVVEDLGQPRATLLCSHCLVEMH
jgi:hypothetical protein